MGFSLSDLYSPSAISGALSGGATGFMVGGPVGAAIGAAGGDLLGGESNNLRNQATANQQKSLQQVMQNLQTMNQQDYSQHIANLNKALSFYGPAASKWNELYATPTTRMNTNPKVS
jgi:gas vesicle protein